MPMPHRTFRRVIKRRLVGKEGSARTRELRAILGELPDYRNGPYADLRKWGNAQIEESHIRATTPAGPPAGLAALRAELAAAGVDLPAIVAATKEDDTGPGAVDALRRAVPDLPVTAMSVLDDGSLDALRAAIWSLTGLVRVHLRRDGVTDPDPVALAPPVTVAGVARTIHHEVGAACRGARLWGPSARFPAPRVGPAHPLADLDTVGIVT